MYKIKCTTTASGLDNKIIALHFSLPNCNVSTPAASCTNTIKERVRGNINKGSVITLNDLGKGLLVEVVFV